MKLMTSVQGCGWDLQLGLSPVRTLQLVMLNPQGKAPYQGKLACTCCPGYLLF